MHLTNFHPDRLTLRHLAPPLAGGLLALGLGVALAIGGARAAETHSVPGPCHGRSDANLLINAHAQQPKFILNLSTDALGVPYGVLILDRGKERLYADLFCRAWKHRPGDSPGGSCEGEEPHAAVTVVHAVGLGLLTDGTEVLVRVDARETSEGKFFRVRYRIRAHHPESAASLAPTSGEDEGGCEDETWTRVPAEGWAPLKMLKVRLSE